MLDNKQATAAAAAAASSTTQIRIRNNNTARSKLHRTSSAATVLMLTVWRCGPWAALLGAWKEMSWPPNPNVAPDGRLSHLGACETTPVATFVKGSVFVNAAIELTEIVPSNEAVARRPVVVYVCVCVCESERERERGARKLSKIAEKERKRKRKKEEEKE